MVMMMIVLGFAILASSGPTRPPDTRHKPPSCSIKS